MNGDGYADVIVGANLSDTGSTDGGRAYVYTVDTSGRYRVLSPNGGEQWVIGREQSVRWLGADLADLWISFDSGGSYSLLASGVGGGEQNQFAVITPPPATAYARIRVSASGEPVTHASSDASDAVFSIVAPHDPPAAAHRLQIAPTGEAMGDQFGASVSDAGDVNGDGYADVIVGANANDSGGSDAGRAYV